MHSSLSNPISVKLVSSLTFFFKVKHLRTKYKILDIEVDGGVGIQTIETAAQVSVNASFVIIDSQTHVLRVTCSLTRL